MSRLPTNSGLMSSRPGTLSGMASIISGVRRTALPLTNPCQGSVVREGKPRTMPCPIPWNRLIWALATESPKASNRTTEKVPQMTPDRVRAVRSGCRTRSRNRLRTRVPNMDLLDLAGRPFDDLVSLFEAGEDLDVQAVGEAGLDLHLLCLFALGLALARPFGHLDEPLAVLEDDQA